MPKPSKSKVHIHSTPSVVVEAAKAPEALTLEQRKKQAEEPIYLNRL